MCYVENRVRRMKRKQEVVGINELSEKQWCSVPALSPLLGPLLPDTASMVRRSQDPVAQAHEG